MSYDIFYYSDRAMKRRQAGMDSDVDSMRIPRQRPSVDGAEVAHAIRRDVPGDDWYGYDGKWHREPPRAALR